MSGSSPVYLLSQVLAFIFPCMSVDFKLALLCIFVKYERFQTNSYGYPHSIFCDFLSRLSTCRGTFLISKAKYIIYIYVCVCVCVCVWGGGGGCYPDIILI